MEQKETNWIPNAKQIKIAELLLNPEDRRTKTEKMKEAGVSRKTFYEWMKDDKFIDYLNNNIKQYVKGELADVWRSLLMQVKRGNVNAIKLYFELIGEYQQSVKQNITSINTNFNIETDLEAWKAKATPEELANGDKLSWEQIQEIMRR